MVKIDYSKPVDRNSIDMEAYNAKFKLADDYIAGKVTNPMDVVRLLKDYTTKSYIFLKDNEGKRVKLYPWQDLVMQDMHDRIYVRGANQIGKDFWINCEVCCDLLTDHGHAYNIGVVSQSLQQASFQMRRIKAMLYSCKARWRNDTDNEVDNMSTITIGKKDENGKTKYKNTLIIAPCTAGLLGYDLHKLILDEFEYWKDVDKGIAYFYNQIAEPRTYHTKGSIKIISNPNGMENYGADLEKMKILDGTKKFHTYTFDFLDDPTHTPEDLERAKIGKTRQVIESTLLAIRSISDRNYFSPDEIERSYDPKLSINNMLGEQPFFFLDVGAKHDQSVLMGGYIKEDLERKDANNNPLIHVYIPIIKVYPVGYPLSRVVGAYSKEQDSDGWQYEKSVKEYLQEWSVDGTMPEFGCDVTGNSGIVPLFETTGITPQDVVFSGPQKSGMYQRVKELLERGLLHRVKSDEFEYQCARLEMQKSTRGYLQIHHENEDDLDDVPDAMVGMVFLMMPYMTGSAPISLSIIGGEDKDGK